MVRFKISWRDILTVLAAIIVGIYIIYRLALIYGWVPKDFEPSTLMKNEYKQFKIALLNRSVEPDLLGKISKITLAITLNLERNIIKQEQEAANEEEVSARCQENSLFRFFMYLGASEEEKKKCTESDLKLKNAIQESVPQSNPNGQTN